MARMVCIDPAPWTRRAAAKLSFPLDTCMERLRVTMEDRQSNDRRLRDSFTRLRFSQSNTCGVDEMLET